MITKLFKWQSSEISDWEYDSLLLYNVTLQKDFYKFNKGSYFDFVTLNLGEGTLLFSKDNKRTLLKFELNIIEEVNENN